MDNMITQAQFMRLYNETHRENFNEELFQRNNQDIINCMKQIILSGERDKYFTLKVLSIKEYYNYEEIINILKDHLDKNRKKNSKLENPYDYISINDSDYMLLEVKWFMRHNGEEIINIKGVDELVSNPWDIMTVYIILPRFTRKYYLRLNGNYYSDIFQIVDGSTYNNTTNGAKSKKVPCNTFKTMFTPIKIYRLFYDMVDVASNTPVRHTLYTAVINIVFNNSVNCMYYILANFGLQYAMDFLDIHCVRILTEPILNDDWYNFEKNGIYISYPKYCGQDPMVQAFAATIYNAIDNSTVIDDLFNIRYWIRLLGRCFRNDSIEKGLFILDALDGTYDLITKEQLHLPENAKFDIYQILRWLMREFNYIRKKNNVDVTLKRYRIGEPIAAVYARKLIMGLSRLADMGKKVTLASIKRHLYTHPMYVINNIINMSNLISYRDLVNDLDSTQAIKYTYKGISGLGENKTEIQQTYRYVDPSHAGILDLDSSTTSDPGMSGTICPLTKIYPGNSFSDYQEPNFWEEKYKRYQEEFFMANFPDKLPVITFHKQPETDMYNLRKQVVKENLEIDKPICPIRNVVDPTYDYSIAGSRLRQEKAETEQVQSLFKIREDDSLTSDDYLDYEDDNY